MKDDVVRSLKAKEETEWTEEETEQLIEFYKQNDQGQKLERLKFQEAV